ncbi:YfgM family protein [Thalassolituus pacificus]|jgi:predicted negative regulator of RcsB-dependent stress response|uniref:Ancillary SecYEG translocon subunit n=1 Tax=Thalassolituus pacificus TaxID=2975440 RepID=A0A9X2WIS0_9GAMM|nr:tetratricopeptide repeat protein [Thalassolituus pacificus]MCT7360850.1 tetratricopeptide repeat protein [Thalassolituus pacificus]
MTEYRTDEEQAELLKKWWAENGKSLLATIVIVAGGWFGWNSYQANEQATAENASMLYSQLVDKVAQPVAQQDEAAKAEMEALAMQLKKDFGNTSYGQFGALFLARFAADAGDFDTAAAELNGVIATAEEGPIKYTAQARLANILIQQEKMDEALALVATVPDAAYATQFEEAKGDALFRKGELSEARAAYIRAQEAAANLGLNTQQLQRKIDNLAASGDA